MCGCQILLYYENFINCCSISNFIGPSDYEMIAKLKIFYLKLELINEKYFKDYKDNPSQQFRKLSSEIENEVKFCLDITEMIF